MVGERNGDRLNHMEVEREGWRLMTGGFLPYFIKTQAQLHTILALNIVTTTSHVDPHLKAIVTPSWLAEHPSTNPRFRKAQTVSAVCRGPRVWAEQLLQDERPWCRITSRL